MVYRAQKMTAERFAKAKDLQLQIEKYGVVPQRTFYYFTDMIAEVERLRAIVDKTIEEKQNHAYGNGDYIHELEERNREYENKLGYY